MDETSFRGDCGRCAGLCCVALAFDRGPLFGFDKQAGEVCRHLDATHRCAIHDRLEREGFAGCASYDCLGAGQLATEMFDGLDLNLPAVARARSAAFARLRDIQVLRVAAHRMASETADKIEPLLAPALVSYSALLAADLVAARAVLRGLAGIGAPT